MILSPFERLVAMRYLGARREEGFLSVIAGFSLAGIALGVGTLIVVMSVMNGFRTELLGRILGLNGHIGVHAEGARYLENYESLADRLRRVDGVVRVTPVVQDQVMATANGRAHGALVRGVPPDMLKRRAIIADNIRAGSLAKFGGKRAIVVGARFAERLGLKPGDRVRLVSRHTRPTAFGPLPRIKTYVVAATFEVGMFEYDDSFVFLPLAAAQLHFATGKGITNLEIALDDADNLQAAAIAIRNAAARPVRLLDWTQSNAGFFRVVEVQRNVLFLILTLIIVVAALNIVSGLIMLVKDKGRDIAILRTMGATRGAVLRIFLLAGSVVGVAGTLIGLGLGVAFAANIESIRRWLEGLTGTELFSAQIYYLTQLPSRIETGDVIGVVAMSLGLSFVATLYPAWRVARLDPVEALRYE